MHIHKLPDNMPFNDSHACHIVAAAFVVLMEVVLLSS